MDEITKVQLPDDEGGPAESGGSSKGLPDEGARTPVTRRRVLGLLGALCGLGLMPLSAKAWPGVGGGWYTQGGGSNGGMAYNGRAVGYCNGWQIEWPCSRYPYPNDQLLRLALGTEIGCAYSNELYNHMYAMPLMACGDTNDQGPARLWFLGGDDNWGTIFRSGAAISTFSGDLCNEECGGGRGRRDTGFKNYSYSVPRWFERRQRAARSENFTSKVDISNVKAPFAPNARGGYVMPPDIFTTLWLGVDIQQAQDAIALRNRTDLYGLIVKICAAGKENLVVDIDRGSQSTGANIQLYEYFDATNQNFLVKPGAQEETSGMLHILSPVHCTGLGMCMNQDGADAPHVDAAGNAIKSSNVVQHPYDGTAACHWWAVDHGGKTFLFCDGSGHVLDRFGGGLVSGTNIRAYSTGWCDQWSNSAETWTIREVPYTGSIRIPETCRCPNELRCPDPAKTCVPTDAKSTKSVSYRYRWYEADDDETPEPDGAVLYAQAHASEIGDMAEALSHGHIGAPHLGAAIEALRLRVSGSRWPGGISYQVRGVSGAWSPAASNGQWCGTKGVSYRWNAIRIWLTGELADHYDLDVRVFLDRIGWTAHGYHRSSADETGADDGTMAARGMCVRLVRKPTGGRPATAWLTSRTYKPSVEQDGKYLYCSTELALDGIGTTDAQVFSDRYKGQVISNACRVIGKLRAHFMCVDTDGDVSEVHTAEFHFGSLLTARDESFAAALDGVRALFEDQDTSRIDEALDGWYLGGPDYEDSVFDKDVFERIKMRKDIYLWCMIDVGGVVFYSDGCSAENVVYKMTRVLVGTTVSLPAEASSGAIEPCCNLDADFGRQDSSGWTGWCGDPALTRRVDSVTVSEARQYPVYGRNRLTVRCEYAEDSARPEPGSDYRTEPRDGAPHAARAMMLPDFAGTDSHRAAGPDGKTISLTPIGDDGVGHKAFYRGETVRLAVPAPVYENLGDGRWRCYKAEAWLPDQSSGGTSDAFKAARDSERFVRWSEVESDGVVSRRYGDSGGAK